MKTAAASLAEPLAIVSTRGIARVAIASAASKTTKQRRLPESLSIRQFPPCSAQNWDFLPTDN